MTQITIDPALVNRLKSADGPVELCEPGGTVIGEFRPVFGKPPAGMESPLSRDEIERRRRGNATLATSQVLDRLAGQ